MPPKPGTPEHDVWRQKLSAAAKVRVITDETRAKLRLVRSGSRNPNYGKKHSSDTLKKISDGVRRNRGKNTEETARKLSAAIKRAWDNDPDRKRRAAERSSTRVRDEDERRRMSEAKILALNDIWYGGVKYNDPQPNKYCILWNANLRNRIRECWGHKSVLSGKTKVDNKNRALCCHHVYYQKKACCQWDEDAGGYYCYIDGKRYNIEGDPNKFVTLTNAENTMVNFNKMKWIRIFEKIIEDNGGVCYTPKTLSSRAQ